MSVSRDILGWAINGGLPLAGLALHLWLCWQMRLRAVPDWPRLPLFILIVTYGGWLMVGLTLLFWEWSGLAGMGFFYLVLGAPLISGVVAWGLRGQRHLSPFHRWVFRASAVYAATMAPVVAGWLLVSLMEH